MVSNLDYTPKLALKKGFEHVPKTLKVESRGIATNRRNTLKTLAFRQCSIFVPPLRTP